MLSQRLISSSSGAQVSERDWDPSQLLRLCRAACLDIAANGIRNITCAPLPLKACSEVMQGLVRAVL